jgi:hypothetical protein
MLLSHGAISFPVGTQLDIEDYKYEKPNQHFLQSTRHGYREWTMASGWSGNPETTERTGHTILRVPVKTSNVNRGILLALDGLCLVQPALPDVTPTVSEQRQPPRHPAAQCAEAGNVDARETSAATRKRRHRLSSEQRRRRIGG